MRNELNIIEHIERYLRDELSVEDKKAFEEKLKTDVNLQKEVELQKDIVKGIERVGVKQSIQKAYKGYRFEKRMFNLGLIVIVLCTIVTTILFIQDETVVIEEPQEDIISSNFINPPISHVNIIFEKYSVSADIGDTIVHKSGTILMFPPKSFVDKNGIIISGTVDVLFREFSTPLDFFISGIPMNYDSAGVSYNFESSGMCEVNAFKDGKPVFVNPQNKPEINLVSKNDSEEHNLYRLDTVQEKWLGKGKSEIYHLDDVVKGDLASEESVLEKPIKPKKLNPDNPNFFIIIEPGSFPELEVYDDLLFELDQEDKKFKAKDSKELWSDVQVKKSKLAGKYNVIFSNEKRKVSYLAFPVFEGKGYDEAIVVFDKINGKYELELNKRLKREEVYRAQNEKSEMENRKTEELNRIIELENNKILEERKLIKIEAQNKKIEFEKKKEEYELRLAEKREVNAKKRKKYELDRKKYEEELLKFKLEIKVNEQKEMALAVQKGKDNEINRVIYRSFGLDGFGIWNCDKPVLQESLKVLANYIDGKGNVLSLNTVSVIYKGFNGIMKQYGSKLDLIKGKEHSIFAVLNGKFVYLNNVQLDAKQSVKLQSVQSFTMNVSDNEIKSFLDIKRVLGVDKN